MRGSNSTKKLHISLGQWRKTETGQVVWCETRAAELHESGLHVDKPAFETIEKRKANIQAAQEKKQSQLAEKISHRQAYAERQHNAFLQQRINQPGLWHKTAQEDELAVQPKNASGFLPPIKPKR